MKTIAKAAALTWAIFMTACVLSLLATPAPEPPPAPELPTDVLTLASPKSVGLIEVDARGPGIWITSPRTGRVRVLTEADLRSPGRRPGVPGALGATAETD